jgi:single-strand DNA-binding protein
VFDTTVTVVGNVLNTPEFRRLKDSHAVVANFKVAATSRRYDRLTNSWVDGASLRVRVNCWRRLAENVGYCVHVGDPVIVTGRLYSRDWVGDDQIRRLSYELDATTVGHDLSRGVDKFTRKRSNLTTSATEDADADQRIGGEFAELVPELNGRPRSRSFDDELGGFITSVEQEPFDGGGTADDPFSDDVLIGLTGDDDDFPDDAARTADTSGEPDSEPDSEPDDGSDSDPDSGSDDGSDSGSDDGEILAPGRKRRRREPVGV